MFATIISNRNFLAWHRRNQTPQKIGGEFLTG